MTDVPPLTPWTSVGVVTVSFGSESVLPMFLASLRVATRARVRLVVCDNKADPASPVATLVLEAGGTYLDGGGNHGYGAAINRAVRALPPDIEWVVLANPDTVIEAGAIDTLITTGSTAADIGAVGPAIVTADGAPYPSAREVPSLRTGVGHAIFARRWPHNPWSNRYLGRQMQSQHSTDVGWLSGAFVLVRRSVFNEVGGFDEGYFMYFEDVDLGYRFGRAGYRNVFEPKAQVMHTGAHATSVEVASMTRAHHESAIRFLMTRYGAPSQWPIRFALKVGLKARLAIESALSRP